jgi:hypothetical protein
VLIAGTAIAPAEQPAWLERLAARFKEMHQAELSRSARYTRTYRARIKAGQVVLQNIVADETALVTMLVDLKFLDPLQADDRKALALAAGRALEAVCEISHREDATFDRVRLGLCLAALQGKSRGSKLSRPPTTRSRAQD